MPRGDRSLETRGALLRAGAQVFVARGVHGATVRQIVDAAGLTIPALYYHFKGKEDLYAVLIGEARATFRQRLSEVLAAKSPPVDKLYAIAAVYVNFGREDPLRLRVLCNELFRPRSVEEADHEMVHLNQWTNASIEKVLTAAARSDVLPLSNVAHGRRMFMALLTGILVEQARDPGTPVLDERLPARAVGTFLEGIAGTRTTRA
jgi:AcrR family transcriptional regulator